MRRAASWAAAGPAVDYAAIADEWEAAKLAVDGPVREPLPPLAHPGALALLREVRAGRPVTPSPGEAAYLLPFVDPVPPGWPELAVTAVVEGIAAGPGLVRPCRRRPDPAPARPRRCRPGRRRARCGRRGSAARPGPRDTRGGARRGPGDVALLTELAGQVDADLVAELCRVAVLAVRDGVDVSRSSGCRTPYA